MRQGDKEAVNLPKSQLLLVFFSALLCFATAARRAVHFSPDFVPVYTGVQCMVYGCNPYDTQQLERQYYERGGIAAELQPWKMEMPVYPPSTFLALSPLALLSFPAARALWFVVNAGLFVTAAVLVLAMCPPSYSWLGAALTSFFVATSGIAFELGQPAIFSISLLIIGTYLYRRGRMLLLGTLLLALSLAVKPQIGGLIVLYLLIGGVRRRYAAGALAGALALLLCGGSILSLRPHSSAWSSALRSNIASTVEPGAINDPRPANPNAIGDINLQTVASVYFTDPKGFNFASYAVFAALLALLAAALVKTKADRETQQETHLIALGALSVLSLIPVYHRFYDTRLLLLSIPAVMLVFTMQRALGSVIAGITLFVDVSLQYRVQRFLLQRAEWRSVLRHKLLFILLLRPQNLALLLLFCLYLAALLSLLVRERQSRASQAAAGQPFEFRVL